MPGNQIPNRFTSPTPQAISDLFDKVNFLLSEQAKASAPVSTTPSLTTTTVIHATNISGASGLAAGPQFADIPVLPAVPSNNPTQGAPYAQDGLLILVHDQLWRYTGAPTYAWSQVATGTVLLDDTHVNRVLNYPATTYPDALFVETDTLILLWSTGGIWTTLSGSVQATHAQRLTTWPSVQFSSGTPFFETDRTVTYTVKDATGTVTVAGGVNVTWTAGNKFINSGSGFNAAQWPVGTPITIGGIASTVSVVLSSTTLTLATAVTNGAGQAYTVASGRWVYLSGQCTTAQASIPADLGENEATTVGGILIAGFLENVEDYAHILQWGGSGYQWGPGESGGGYFQDFAVAPTGSGWHISDGSAGVACLKPDGTTVTITLPNRSTASYRKLAAAYAAAITAAVTPTISGHTELATASISGSTDPSATGITLNATTGVDNGAGTVVAAGVGTTVASHTHDHNSPALTDPSHTHTSGSIADSGHQHNLTSANAPISIAGGDPIAHNAAIEYFRQ